MAQQSRSAIFSIYASQWPVGYALLTGTSFVGLSWLTEPLLARIGLPGDVTRGHLFFVGTFFGIGMTVLARRTRGPSSIPRT